MPLSSQVPLWKQIQRQNFTKWRELAAYLELPLSYIPHIEGFPLNLPRRLAEKIEKNSLTDPILKQFLPSPLEASSPPGFSSNPLEEDLAKKTGKALQKYEGRVLLVCSSACAMHCRYCFRKHYPYEAPSDFKNELISIQHDKTLYEVILSGGDPLSLSDEKLLVLMDQLSEIEHLKILRFHTRFPVGIPERITEEFLNGLKKNRLQTVFVVHINHPRELDCDVISALKRIQSLGIPLLNQSVLLKGVNDNLETLLHLCKSLIAAGVIPYYLHQLDRVSGSAHFEVPIERGLRLVQELQRCLSGYAVPRYVKEIPFETSKTPLHPVECFTPQQFKTLTENLSCQFTE